MTANRKHTALVPLLYCIPLLLACQGQPRYPGEVWQQYATPEEAGWSSQRLAGAAAFADSIGSAAYLLAYDGAVVTAWGDVSRRYMCHSVRKSFLSGLYGIHVAAGDIDTGKTLAELGIDDQYDLTDAEREATIHDMLKARSGVYHPAAYETAAMAAARPERGSHPHDTFWYYNNWDFNTLNAIFERETGTRIFEEFDRRIARPLQMQDYRVTDGYYHLEPEHSIYPAYPFRMSARDMARYGLLYLREGRWEDDQIIPASWVRETHYPFSSTGDDPDDGGYGYMWWIIGGDLAQYDTYSALGVGSQTITVVPALDLVFVHRVDTYAGDRVPTSRIWELLGRLIDARTGEPKAEPQLVPLPDQPSPEQFVSVPAETLEQYAGTYVVGKDTVTMSLQDGQLTAYATGFGTFALQPLSETEFLMEDAEERVLFRTATDGSVDVVLERAMNQEGFQLLREENTRAAIATFRRMIEHFPQAASGYVGLGTAFQVAGNRRLAVENLRRALEIDPRNRRARRQLTELESPSQ